MAGLELSILYSLERSETEKRKRDYPEVENFYAYLSQLQTADEDISRANLYDPLNRIAYVLTFADINTYFSKLWECVKCRGKIYPLVIERPGSFFTPLLHLGGGDETKVRRFVRPFARMLYRNRGGKSDSTFRFNLYKEKDGSFILQLASMRVSEFMDTILTLAKDLAPRSELTVLEDVKDWYVRGFIGSIEAQVTLAFDDEIEIQISDLAEPVSLLDFSINFSNAEEVGGLRAYSFVSSVDDDRLNQLVKNDPELGQIVQLLSMPELRAESLKPEEVRKILGALSSARAKPIADAWLGRELAKDEWALLRTSNHQSIGFLHHFAKKANSRVYKQIIENSQKNLFRELIYKRGGKIAEFDFSILLKQRFGGGCFWSDELKRWGFIETSAEYPKRQYKIQIRDSDSMHNFIQFADELRNYGDSMITEIKQQLTKTEDKDVQIKHNRMISSIETLVGKCGTVSFVQRAIHAARTRFLSREFFHKLDKDGLCIGVRGGIVRLAHWQGDTFVPPEFISEVNTLFVSKAADVDYDPNNPWIEKWDRIHSDVIVEPDAKHFIQTSLATCLDSVTAVNHILVIKASGCNGKSTLTDSTSATLGPDYFDKGDIQLLTTSKRDSNSADNAMEQLKGKRGMNFSETRADTVLLSDQLKHIVGIEPKNSRANYGSKEVFNVCCTMFITTNHTLSMQDNDHGSWRRIKYYEARTKFVEDPQSPDEKKIDPKLENICIKSLEARSGLFMLLLQRHTEFVRDCKGDFSRVPVGRTITETTDRIRREQDKTSIFYDTCLFYVPDSRTSLTRVAQEFRDWNKERERRDMSMVTVENHVRNSMIEKDFVVDPSAKATGEAYYLANAFLLTAKGRAEGLTPPDGAIPYLSVPHHIRAPKGRKVPDSALPTPETDPVSSETI